MADAVPIPKVIDFGVAKALGQSLTDHTLHTGYSQLVGTPLYMSPEQAEMNLFGVDTRSDVYSLGVLLYELLTGTTPFDKEQLKSANFDEMRRMIREDEPPRPSTRVSTLGAEALSTISQRRGTDPRRISATLRGELDWIVMKALEKDRSQRYESASALAADIQRYLSDEPVLACPPTTMYRFQKFARKYQPALATAAAIALCLLLGTTVSAWQAIRATQAEAQATANEAQAKQAAVAEAQQRQRAEANEQKANTQRDEAQRQRDEVKSLNDRLHRTLYAAHMNLAKHAADASGTERVRQLLDQYRPKPGETDLRGFEWYYLHRLGYQGDTTLKGHSSIVTWLAYSPDGKRLASAAYDKTVRVWDVQTGTQLLTLSVEGSVNRVAYSPDGKRLASPSWEGNPKIATVSIWDGQTGNPLPALKGSINEIFEGIAFSPDGKRLAAGSGTVDEAKRGYSAGAVRVWDLETGAEVLTVKGHNNMVWNVAFSPDGKRLASAAGGEIKVWDAQTGEELLSFRGHTSYIYSLAFSADGKRAISADGATRGGTIKIWNPQNGQEFLTLNGNGWVAAMSPDGKRLASVSGNRTIKLWDAETGQELRSLNGHTHGLRCLVFSPDGMHLASASDDRTVRVWDAHAAEKPLTIKTGSVLGRTLALSPDDNRLAGVWDNRILKVWDAKTGKELFSLDGHTGRVTELAMSPDGKRLASASVDKTVKVWDAQTGQQTLSLEGHNDRVGSVVFSPDGKLLASGSADKTVKLWNAQNGQDVLTINVNAIATKLVFSPDGKRLASGSGTPGVTGPPEVKMWDVQTAAEQFLLKGVSAVAFSPDGRRLAGFSGGFPGGPSQPTDIKVCDARSGQELLSLHGHTGNIYSVAFSPDGKRLASASWDQTVKVWDAQAGNLLHSLEGHTTEVIAVAFLPDGKRLASASVDNTTKIWDAESGQELLSLAGRSGPGSLALSSSGHLLANTDGAGTVTIYDATPLQEKP
jgi:WD40 repeat protein